MLKTKTTHKNIIISLLLVLGIVMLPNSLLAQSVGELRQQINSLTSEIKESENRIGQLQKRKDTLQNRLSILNAEAEKIQSEINTTEKQIDRTKTDIRQKKAELKRTKELIQENARVLYKQGDPSTVEILFSSNNFSDFINRQEYLDSAKESMNEAAAKATKIKEQLEAKKSELDSRAKKLRGQKSHLASKQEEQRMLIAQTQGEERRYQNLVNNLQEKKEAAESALVASLSSGSYKVSPVGPVGAGDVVGSIGSTGLSSGPHLHLEVRVGGSVTDPRPYIRSRPVGPMSAVTQPYDNPDPIYRGGYHPGIDYGGGDGAPIYAINSGYMYRGCSNRLLGTTENEYGYVAIVEHGGFVSIYAHMSGGPAACNYNTYY